MDWFGPAELTPDTWSACQRRGTRVAVPVDESCFACGIRFTARDAGERLPAWRGGVFEWAYRHASCSG